ncbi:hypothetical protein [Halopelagius longus]|uniref:Uncharacterized protein n=1 Tax=Halopelagius longus TaxID=1236180 RepID=A0A370IJF2_9EURY|nr:hypothetical protein [Halopelagius longus]RDI70846.1 hypothetical protein DWB78_03395 [Halopelagius longus]
MRRATPPYSDCTAPPPPHLSLFGDAGASHGYHPGLTAESGTDASTDPSDSLLVADRYRTACYAP